MLNTCARLRPREVTDKPEVLQVVWKGSTQLGCASAVCPDGMTHYFCRSHLLALTNIVYIKTRRQGTKLGRHLRAVASSALDGLNTV